MAPHFHIHHQAIKNVFHPSTDSLALVMYFTGH